MNEYACRRTGRREISAEYSRALNCDFIHGAGNWPVD